MTVPLLMAKGLKKLWNRTEAISGVDFEVHPGEIWGLIGPSGAGKSTLLSLLSTHDQPTEGELFIDGFAFHHLNPEHQRLLRKEIGVVLQGFHLFSSRTVFENIAFPFEIHGISNYQTQITELLEMLDILHRKDAYPAQLSGGEKQRAAIARALALKPKLLFCDEATSALDAKNKEQTLNLFARVRDEWKTSLVIVTHQMEWVPLCTHLAVMDKGKIVERGPSRHLLRQGMHPLTRRLLQEVHGV